MIFPVVAPQGAVRDEPATVRDLGYGEALYYFYEGDFFSAITRLQVARQHDLLKHHQDDARLLLGGLYLSYGLHQEAGDIFEQLLDQNTDIAVRNRARLYLAKIWYQRGYLDKAENALLQVQGKKLPAEQDAERRLLLTYIYMSQGRYGEAVDILENWKDANGAGAYGQYNLGVSLIRSGQVEQGFILLDKLGLMRAEDAEMRALRDKANLALGYTYLQQEKPDLARIYLERIQLDGLASGKALLGLGWAESSQGNYRQALVPWVRLSRRNTVDASVQEAQLAIPYALLHLNARQQAIRYYQDAIATFQDEAEQLKRLQKEFSQGSVAEGFLQDDEIDGMGWYWRLDALPPGLKSRYLFELLSQHEFQEVLKNYRDLKYLQRNLRQWEDSIDAFEDMLALRRDTYEARVPRIQASYQDFDLEQTRQQRDEYLRRLTDIEQRDDVAGLATAGERALHERLETIERIIATYPHNERVASRQEKQRLLRGVLLWQESQDFKARLWRTRKNIKDLDQQIRLADQARVSIETAQHEAPQGFEGFDRQITQHSGQIQQLQARIEQSLAGQERYLQSLVLTELERRGKRLYEYLAQARYGLARIYDMTATGEETLP